MMMSGRVRGSGALLVKGEPAGSVTYEFDCRVAPNGRRLAAGKAFGTKEGLKRASKASDVTLELESGDCVRIMVNRLTRNGADVVVCGKFPGY